MNCLNFRKYLKDTMGFKEDQFEALLPFLEIEEVAKGQLLTENPNADGSLFFVDKGLLRFYSIDTMGKERILQFAPENWFIGDRANLCRLRATPPEYVYRMDAVEDSIVVRLTKDFGKEISKIQPNFRQINERLLQNHILHLQHRINLLIGSNVQERYEDFIQMYPDLLQRIPQWMIASYLGVTPEGLSRVRKDIARGK